MASTHPRYKVGDLVWLKACEEYTPVPREKAKVLAVEELEWGACYTVQVWETEDPHDDGLREGGVQMIEGLWEGDE